MMTRDAGNKRSIESVKKFCVHAMEDAALEGEWRDKPRQAQAKALGIQMGFFARIIQPAYPGPAGEWWALVAVACWKAWALEGASIPKKKQEPSMLGDVDFAILEASFLNFEKTAGFVEMSMGLDYWTEGRQKMSIISGFSACTENGWEPLKGGEGAKAKERVKGGGLSGLRQLRPDIQDALPESEEDWREIMETAGRGLLVDPVIRGLSMDPLAWLEKRLLAKVADAGQTEARRGALRI